MRKVCLILSLLALTASSHAQRLSDTLIVYMEERLEMRLILDDFIDLKEDSAKQSIRKILGDFQALLPQMDKALDPNVAEVLRFKGDEKISLSKGKDKVDFVLDGGALKNSGPRDLAILLHPLVRIELRTTNILDAVNMPIVAKFDEMLSRLPQKTRYAKTLGFSVKNDTMDILPEKLAKNSAGDYIELGVGAAANLYKGKWLGEFQTRLDLKFSTKNVLKSNPYVSLSWLYDVSRLDRVNINTFLNVGHQWDLSGGKDEETLFGIEAGFLLSRSGNLFEPKTWRLGLNWEAGDGIGISPMMYVVGGFEKVQPGIRITFGL